jgi:imidazolonepropionase-like amidohydrolase
MAERPAIKDAVIVVHGTRIAGAGPRAFVHVPAGATVIDGSGRS